MVKRGKIGTSEDKLQLLKDFWGRHELFYKGLYEARQTSKEAYEDYLSRYDLEELKRDHLRVPDKMDQPDAFGEEAPLFRLDTDIAVWRHSRYTPAFMHAHDYFAIMCVMSGKLTHTIEDYAPMILEAGDICFIPNGVKHAVESYDYDMILINIMVTRSVFESAFFEILSEDNMLAVFFRRALEGKRNHDYMLFKTGENADLRSIVLFMFFEYYYSEKYYSRILSNMLQSFFSFILRDYETYFRPTEDKKKLEIAGYLQKHYKEATLKSTAAYFHYNQAYFSRMIKEYTGKTFSELIREYRMNQAVKLLEESDFMVNEIAQMVGYGSIEHFTRAFRDDFGISPLQYRKRHQEQTEQ